eukprot:TRINITY_DN904_c5_g1_i1.p1 TRINITY_DN904_c5_g1~~TRINITY_DN904_c5_g1_i1.p1  ORF type:complete len:783 (+),score=90.66 TRINITY_DN904_c5_g1_i1:123-2471(+)
MATSGTAVVPAIKKLTKGSSSLRDASAAAGQGTSSVALPRASGAKYWGLDQKLLEAVQSGTAEQVEQLILGGCSAEVIIHHSGQNLVFYAAVRPSPAGGAPCDSALSMVQLLVERHGLNCALVDKLMFQTPLFYAAREGNVALCSYLIRHRCNVDERDVNLQTALFYAANKGHTACVRSLVEQRASFDQKDRVGQTPLYFAARASEDVVRWLLNARANASHRDSNALTPLCRASSQCAAALLDAGADANSRDGNTRTPIFHAAANGDCALLKLLCDRGAQLDAVDATGATCLFAAAQGGHSEACAFLVDELGMNAHHVDHENKSAVHRALMHKKTAVVAYLESAVASQNERDCSVGVRPVNVGSELGKKAYAAVLNGSLDDVRNAFAKVSPLSIVVAKGQTLVHHAAARLSGALEVCKFLVESYIDPTVADDMFKQTALFFAVRPSFKLGGEESDPDCARYLLSMRSDPNASDVNSQTPLFYAAKRRNPECVLALLEARADPNFLDFQHETALRYATEAASLPCVRALLDARADAANRSIKCRTPLFNAAVVNDPQPLIQLLLDGRCSANAVDTAGVSVMAVAAARGCGQALRALVAGGGDLEATDELGETCLFYAARGVPQGSDFREKMCELLVKELGANPLHKNHQGKTAADLFDSPVLRPNLAGGALARLNASPPQADVDAAANGRGTKRGRGAAAVATSGETQAALAAASPAPAAEASAEAAPTRRRYRLIFDDPANPGRTLQPGSPRYSKACRELAAAWPFLHYAWYGRHESGGGAA